MVFIRTVLIVFKFDCRGVISVEKYQKDFHSENYGSGCLLSWHNRFLQIVSACELVLIALLFTPRLPHLLHYFLLPPIYYRVDFKIALLSFRIQNLNLIGCNAVHVGSFADMNNSSFISLVHTLSAAPRVGTLSYYQFDPMYMFPRLNVTFNPFLLILT